MRRVCNSTGFRETQPLVVMSLKALVWSFVFVGISAAFVGAIVEFFVEREWSDESSIVQCASTGDGDRIVILARTLLGEERPTRYRLWLYDPAQAARPVNLPWTSSKPCCIACIPGTERIAVGGWDGSIHLAETTVPSQPPDLLGRHLDGGVISIKCSADGRYLASQSASSLRVWDLVSNELLWDHVATDMTCHAIDASSGSVLSGHSNGRIEAWELRSGETLRTKPIRLNRGSVCDVKFHVDGSLLVTVAGAYGVYAESLLLRWQPDDNHWRHDFTFPCGLARVSVISPDCACIVTTSEVDQSSLDVWEVHSGRRLGMLVGHRQMVLGAVFSSNRFLVSWSTDGTIRIWDVANQSAVNVVVLPLA